MSLFKRKKPIKRNIPTWAETVEIMHDKYPNYIEGYKIIDVLYSSDNTHRFIILEIDSEYLTYSFESLQPYDEDELIYFSDDEFAYWLPQNNSAKPIFDDLEILMRELKTTPEYKTYFDNE